MPSTYTLISSNILTTTASPISFTSIPSTYTDLVLRISARSNSSSLTDRLNIYVNGNPSSFTTVQGNGSAASSNRASGEISDTIDAGTATSNTFSSSEIYIPSYAGSSNKPFSSIHAMETNGATAYITAVAHLRSSTAAITSIDLYTYLGSFIAGSSFYLYGIKNS
jgi:hypothetical protein